MFEQKTVLVFIHLLSFAILLGAPIFEVFILPSVLREKSMNPKDRIQLIIRSINLSSPISFVMLVAIIFTGIFLIFDLYEKISHISSPLYLNVFFIKIMLLVIIFPIAAYQNFYLRFKIGALNIEKIKGENLPRPFRLMQTCYKINFILIIIVLFLGVAMSNLT